MPEKTANMCGITAIVIWCMTPAMLALTGAAPPFLVGAFAFLAAFAVACAWWLYKGESIAAKFDMPLSSYAFGTYGIGLYNVLYIYSFKTGPTMEVNLLNYLWPACLIVFSCLCLKKKPDAFALAGIGLCLAGVFFVFASRGPVSFSGSHLMMLAGLLCGVMWGSYSALSKFVSGNADRVAVFFLIAGVVMLLLHLAFEPTVWPGTALGWGMLLAYTFSRIAFFFWDHAMKHGQARVIGSLSYFIPLFATLFLMLAGFATYNPSLLTGAALIISGCLVINLKSLMQVWDGFLLKRGYA
jgi:drug/metabolite transporter (DMT)-like permease